jgi:hypothetical protein
MWLKIAKNHKKLKFSKKTKYKFLWSEMTLFYITSTKNSESPDRTCPNRILANTINLYL